MGDVLLCGPAVRAVAASEQIDQVWMLCSSAGAQAAGMLPGVDRVLVWDCPWITAGGAPSTPEHLESLADLVQEAAAEVAVILTSFHQSPLPLALILRLIGVPKIVGASVDHAGSLLDVRLVPGEDFREDQPEPQRALAIAAAAGFVPARDDDGLLHLRHDAMPPLPAEIAALGRYVVVHPGASAPARRWPAERFAEMAQLLDETGIPVVVTGGRDETDLTSAVSAGGAHAIDCGGRLSLPGLAAVIAGAGAVVVGNTGPAHIAAAVGTPVVSLFSPVVPAARWAPYRVPHVLLGDQWASCRGSRARQCPVAGHPCLSQVTPGEVVAAVLELTRLARAQVEVAS